VTGTAKQIAAYIQLGSLHGKHVLIVWVLATFPPVMHISVLVRLRQFIIYRSASLWARDLLVVLDSQMP
jgi:hypothetical protein